VTRFRRVALVLAGVALVGVAALVALAYLATAHSDRMLAALSRALGRDVRASHIGFTLRGGVGVAVDGVEIADDPAAGAREPFLRAGTLAMRLRLLPLVRRELVVDGVLIEAPVVNLVRDRSGHLNVESFRKERAPAAPSDEGSGTRQRPAFQLVSVRLRHGTIRYRDEASGRTVELADLALDARQPQLDAPVPVSVRARLATEDLRLDGIVSEGVLDLAGERPEYRGTLQAGPGAVGTIPLERVTGKVRAAPPIVDLESGEVATLGGQITCTAHLDGEAAAGHPGLTAQLAVRNLDLAKLPAPPDRPRPAGSLTLDGNLAAPPPGAPGFKAGATGQGNFAVADGRVEGAGFGRPVLEALQLFLKPGVADRLSNRYPDLFATDDLRFTRLSGSGRLADGRIRSDDLVLAATSWEARGEGTLGLDGDVDAAVRLAASQGLTDDVLGQLRARATLVDTSGRLTIPLRVRGPVRRPKVTPDPEFAATAARALIGGGLGDVAGDMLQKLFGRHKR